MQHIEEVLFDLILSIWLVEAAALKIIATTDSLDHVFILFHSSKVPGLTLFLS